MNQLVDAICTLALEVQELKEAVEQLTDRISEAAELWQPRPDAALPPQENGFKPNPVDNQEGGQQLCLKMRS